MNNVMHRDKIISRMPWSARWRFTIGCIALMGCGVQDMGGPSGSPSKDSSDVESLDGEPDELAGDEGLLEPIDPSLWVPSDKQVVYGEGLDPEGMEWLPELQVKPVCTTQYPLILGHRGFAWNHIYNPYPENTVLSVLAAIGTGADGVEVDVTKTLDGVIVLAHENNLAYLKDGVPKTSCTGKISSSNYQDIQDCTVNSSMPGGMTTKLNTLDELVMIGGDFPVALDIKNDALGDGIETVDIIMDLLEEKKVTYRFILMLYKEESVKYALTRAERVCHKRHTMGDLSLEQVLDGLEAMGATCLCVNDAILDEAFMAGLQRIGVNAFPYALGIDRKVGEILSLIDLYAQYGVWGVLTEHLEDTLTYRATCGDASTISASD